MPSASVDVLVSAPLDVLVSSKLYKTASCCFAPNWAPKVRPDFAWERPKIFNQYARAHQLLMSKKVE